MKKILVLSSILLLVGCTNTTNLESRISHLEQIQTKQLEREKGELQVLDTHNKNFQYISKALNEHSDGIRELSALAKNHKQAIEILDKRTR